MSEPPSPAPAVRERTLAKTFTRRQPTRTVTAVAPYAGQVAVLDLLLGELIAEQWATVVIYDWTVPDVLAHLSATDSLLAAGIGLDDPGVPGESLDARTDRFVAEARSHPPALTWAAWRARAAELCRHLADGGAALAARPVEIAGRRLPAGAHAVGRAFETWIHARDIAVRLAIGPPRPSVAHLNAMAGLAVDLLRRPLGRIGSIRLALSGPGGGDWLIPADAPPCADAARPDAGVTLDVLDFCLIAAGRLDAAAATVQVTGDPDVAAAVLAAVPTLAGR